MQPSKISFTFKSISILLIDNGFPRRSFQEHINDNSDIMAGFIDFAHTQELYSDLSNIQKKDTLNLKYAIFANSSLNGTSVTLVVGNTLTLLELSFIYTVSKINKEVFIDLINTLCDRYRYDSETYINRFEEYSKFCSSILSKEKSKA